MFGMFAKLLPSVLEVVPKIFGDKVQKESNVHDEQMAAMNAMSAEYMGARENRTIWDSFVDGINRLVRPIMAFAVLWLFVWAIINPIAFSAAMQAYTLVPEPLWYLLMTIVSMFFGGRILEKWNGKYVPPSVEQVQSVVNNIQQMKSIEKPVESPPATESTVIAEMISRGKPVMSDEEFSRQMQSSEPLSGDAIAEWNRRRQEGWKPS